MHKLIVNPGTDQSWDIPLEPGVTVLGSDPASPCAIAHDSVSPAHCEVHVADGTVTIRDLGSANGTFVNHAPVRESALTHGQDISLGEVNLQFVADGRAAGPAGVRPPIPVRIAPVRPEAPTRIAPSAASPCKFHPKAAATWHCDTCHEYLCDLCINVRNLTGTVRHLCRKCGNDLTPVAIEYAEPERENFFTTLPGAFRYPCRGDGLILMGTGAVCFALLRLMRFAPLAGGIVALGAGVFMTGYLFSYLKEIVATTGNGRNTMPDWPDFNNWTDDILPPAFQFYAIAVLTFGPAIVLRLFHPFDTDEANWGIAAGWLVFCGLLAPMGLLAMAMFDTVAGLNPVVIVRSIARVPGPYFAAAFVFDLVLCAYILLSYLARQAGIPWFLASLVLGFVELYALTVGMRILGLLYRSEKDRLGWP